MPLSNALYYILYYFTLSRRLNAASINVVNSYSACTSFSVSKRLVYYLINIPSETDLESWRESVGLSFRPLIPNNSARHLVLELLYTYYDLNSTDLRDLPATPLITYKV
jgi:hypothetical protein